MIAPLSFPKPAPSLADFSPEERDALIRLLMLSTSPALLAQMGLPEWVADAAVVLADLLKSGA